MADDLMSRTDATIVKPDALAAEVHKVAADAIERGCHGVVAAPVWTARLATMLRGSGVRVISAVSFPSGHSKSTIKAIEATSTIKDGADEIEVAGHLAYVLSFDVDAARAELMEVVRAARSTRRDVIIRPTFDLGPLATLDAERTRRVLETACRATRESGCDGIVVPPASVAVVKPYAEVLTIKAAIVEDRSSALAALEAGADRVGATSVQRVLDGALKQD